jgi:g-D-glutamyl-meso-diaminopimelate peptidase
MPICTSSPVTSKKLTRAIEELLAANPHVHHATIGTSRLGRPIHALTIGHGPKQILFNASHHANEWITTLILMKFLEDCAEKFSADEFTLHFVPLVNPDGVDLVNGGIGKLRYAYKEAEKMHKIETARKRGLGFGEKLFFKKVSPRELSAQKFPACWKSNICGVDLNSNYPGNWELAKKNKFSRGYTSPGARDFVGYEPLCEPESCAMVAYTTFHDIDITVSLHTQGEEIYWRYMDFEPNGAEEMARRFAAASGYKLEEVPDENSHGGYRDWFISTFNRPGFTVECGLGESPLPLEQFGDMYTKVSALLREAFA